MSDHPHTREAMERWRQGKINVFDALAELEDQRDELLRQNADLAESLWKWRICAEKMADWMGVPKYDETWEESVETKNAALAEFNRLKEASK